MSMQSKQYFFPFYLKVASQESIVDDYNDFGASRFQKVRDGFDVDQFQQRIRRRFEPYHLKKKHCSVSTNRNVKIVNLNNGKY